MHSAGIVRTFSIYRLPKASLFENNAAYCEVAAKRLKQEAAALPDEVTLEAGKGTPRLRYVAPELAEEPRLLDKTGSYTFKKRVKRKKLK